LIFVFCNCSTPSAEESSLTAALKQEPFARYPCPLIPGPGNSRAWCHLSGQCGRAKKMPVCPSPVARTIHESLERANPSPIRKKPLNSASPAPVVHHRTTPLWMFCMQNSVPKPPAPRARSTSQLVLVHCPRKFGISGTQTQPFKPNQAHAQLSETVLVHLSVYCAVLSILDVPYRIFYLA